ncbi:MAG: hypothetical protein NE334_10525 [Lentisphaeraceae bacterium]|nr:hypothetical protein [Lentisphaeraceae bacterium]
MSYRNSQDKLLAKSMVDSAQESLIYGLVTGKKRISHVENVRGADKAVPLYGEMLTYANCEVSIRDSSSMISAYFPDYLLVNEVLSRRFSRAEASDISMAIADWQDADRTALARDTERRLDGGQVRNFYFQSKDEFTQLQGMRPELDGFLDKMVINSSVHKFSLVNMPLPLLIPLIGEKQAVKLHEAREEFNLDYQKYLDCISAWPERYKYYGSTFIFDIVITGRSGNAVYSRRLVLDTTATSVPYKVKVLQ